MWPQANASTSYRPAITLDRYPAIDVRGGRVARAPGAVSPLVGGRALTDASVRGGLLMDLNRAADTGEHRELIRHGAIVGRALRQGRCTVGEALACLA